MKINIVKAKRVLIKSGLPASDWVINPYNGCTFGCAYCYAAQIARWNHKSEKWGTFLDVKENAPEVLRKDLDRLAKKSNLKNFGSIFLSSVTDPYVGHEAKYKITRGCLEVLADFGYLGSIAIQTKSPLVLRDIDVLKKLKRVTVGFTVTSLDDKVSRFLECNAPLASMRLKALEKLHEEKISTYAFVGPILPYFLSDLQKIHKLLDRLEKAGVREVWVEHINLNAKIRGRLYSYLRENAPELEAHFEAANSVEYRHKTDMMVQNAMKGRKLTLGYGKVIFHEKN